MEKDLNFEFAGLFESVVVHAKKYFWKASPGQEFAMFDYNFPSLIENIRTGNPEKVQVSALQAEIRRLKIAGQYKNSTAPGAPRVLKFWEALEPVLKHPHLCLPVKETREWLLASGYQLPNGLEASLEELENLQETFFGSSKEVPREVLSPFPPAANLRRW